MIVNSFDFRNSEILDIIEINRFAAFYKSLLTGKNKIPGQIKFLFGDTLKIIDELFYSYLLLFSKDFSNTKIILSFSEYSDAFGIAKQQIAYLELYDVNIALLKAGELENKSLKISSKYFPQLLIEGSALEGKKRLPDFFFSTPDFNNLKKIFLSLSPTDSAQINSSFNNKEYFYESVGKMITLTSFESLYFSYQFSCLQILDILRLYYSQEYAPPLKSRPYKILQFSQENSRFIASETLAILINNGFFTFTYVELFLFHILLSVEGQFQIADFFKDKNGNLFSKAKLNKYLSSLSSLILYVKDISTGLVELAKNIGEHSGLDKNQGFGVISARVFKRTKLQPLKYSGVSFDVWLNQCSQETIYFLDLNVIDSGNLNVTNKYLANLASEIELLKDFNEPFIETIKNDYAQDIIKMTDPVNPYDISNFLNYQQISLFHQVKRVNSRLGLLIFSNLILSKNNGFIKVASNNLKAQNIQECALLFLKNAYGRDILNVEKFDSSQNTFFFTSLGTSYNFIIPVKRYAENDEPVNNKNNVGSPTAPLPSIFKNLRNFKLDDYEAASKNKYINIISGFDKPRRTGKYEKIYEYRDIVINKLANIEKKIAFINAAETTTFLTNSSDWMRFLASVQMIDASLNLIICDIPESIHAEIISINKFFDVTNSGFWNDRYAVLFFIKVTHSYENGHNLSLWFNDLLLGRSYADYRFINREISRYHDNIYRISDDQTIVTATSDLVPTGLFFTEGKLLNFELILENVKGCTLFEESVNSLLDLEIQDERLSVEGTKNHKRIAFFRNLKGYKISKSHFKLGSKIHISDFFYAKRLFYNSFYASRFAYIIANHIFIELLIKGGRQKHEQITLIGYSNYSELLVSNIRRLLNDWGYAEIRHDIVLENEKILKNATNINDNVLIIIPVSSTFTTSQKIKRILRPLNKNISFPFPDINGIVIGNKGFNQPEERFSDNKIVSLYQTFGWKTQWLTGHPNTIDVEHDGEITTQKFFIGLETEWQPIHNCQYCFKEEICLLETERNNVTPDIIFGLPIARKATSDRDFYELLKSKKDRFLISYHHVVKGLNHYYFFVRIGFFLSDSERRQQVIRWLIDTVQQHDDFKENYIQENRIIIVTPSLTSNSGFINLVNQILFQDTATVLQFSAAEDCLQNFVKFNGPLLSNTKIIFVDDVISTGKTFQMINDYIANALILDNRKIDFCITLFNQAGFFEEQTVEKALGSNMGFQYFAKLNIPPLLRDGSLFPFVVQSAIYEKLSRKATLDMMQIHFKEQQMKFEPLEIDLKNEEPKGSLHSLLHFLIYHEIFNLFEGKFQNNYEFEYANEIVDLLKSAEPKAAILKKLQDSICSTTSIKNFLRRHPSYEFEVEYFIIRIFAEAPFVQYKRMKELVFNWVNTKLNVLTDEILICQNESLSDTFFECLEFTAGKPRVREFSKYNTFKLLLRLCVKLKINNLFSEKTLLAMKVLLSKLKNEHVYVRHYETVIPENTIFPDPHKLVPLNDIKNTRRIFAIGLTTYYVGLVQELVVEDEAKAIKLIKNVVNVIQTTQIFRGFVELNLRNDFTHEYLQLLRLLILENSFIFDTFFTNFVRENDELKQYNLDEAIDIHNNYHYFNAECLEKFIKFYRFDALELLLARYDFKYLGNLPIFKNKNLDIDSGLDEAFRKTMYLKTLLRNELIPKTSAEESIVGKQNDLREKIKNILQLLCDILAIDKKDEREGGAYFTIRFRDHHKPASRIIPEDLYTIVNYATEQKHLIERDLSSSESINFKFFKGIQDKHGRKPKTTFELLLTTEHEWKFRDLASEKADILASMELHGEKIYRNLFFLRITDIVETKNNDGKINFTTSPKAVICFYRNPLSEKTPAQRVGRIDPKRVRLLLLLRDDINRFMRHHLSNDSFMAYVEQKEKENYMFTLKHGIETYKRAIQVPMDALKGLENKSKELNKYIEHLEASIHFLTNKIALMSLVSKSLLDNQEIEVEPFTLTNIFDEFENRFKFILKFKHRRLFAIREEEHVSFERTLTLIDSATEIFLPRYFLGELIFELIFNIRKHIVREFRNRITETSPLIIRISIESIDNTLYFVVENNFNYLDDEIFTRKTQLFKEKYSVHGLNLITRILRKNYGTVIFAKSSDGFIMIKVPIKKLLS
jgi:hypothetical protein